MWLLSFACGTSPTPPPSGPDPVVADKAECTDPASCTTACRDASDALACNQLGLWLHDGLVGLGEDRARAAESYRRACELGAGIGCYNLSTMIRTGDGGLEVDPIEANVLLSQARAAYRASCDAGGLGWCLNLAGLLRRGELGSPDPRAALALVEQACNEGGGLACVELADLLISGDAGKPDPERAETLLTEGCDAGTEGACYRLGISIRARGGDAKPHFQKACDRGMPVACRSLAQLIPERDRALQLLEGACDAPNDLDGMSCAMAADLLLEEPGNEAKVFDRLSRACSVGVAPACVKAVVVAATVNLELADNQARSLVERGCALGHDEACQLASTLEPASP